MPKISTGTGGWRRSIPFSFTFVTALILSVPANALIISVDQPNRTSRPGTTELFSGTITNDTTRDLTAQAISLNFSGFDPAVLSFDQLLGFTDFLIPRGTTSADTQLFEVIIGPATSGSTYLADVLAQDPAGELSNIQTISISIAAAQVPEPGSSWLLLFGIGIFALAEQLRRRAIRFSSVLRTGLWSQLPITILLPTILMTSTSSSAHAQTTPVQFATGNIGSSVWEDGTISLAVPIVNRGSSIAANVFVTSISLRTHGVSGTRADEATLPLNLGQISPDARAVLNTRFSGLPFALSYLLTVSGTYEVGSVSSGFSVNSWISPLRGTTQPTTARTNTVIKQRPLGPPFPPVPIIPIPPNVETNPYDGPPVPIGPPRVLFSVPPSNTLVMSAATSAPNVAFNRDTGTNQPLGVPPDPAAAVGGGVVLATDNTYLLVSTDGGPFTNINPTTIPNFHRVGRDGPLVDGGICCDQVVTYVPSVNLFFWLLQYRAAPPAPPDTVGPNRLRIAFATPEAIRADVIHAWTYFDLQSSTFDLSNQALDYPDLAFTDTYLYVNVNAAPNSSSTTIPNDGLIVARMALEELANPSSTTVGVGYLGPNQMSDMNKAIWSRLTQNSRNAMYWAAHNGTSELWVFIWRDNEFSISPPHHAKINTYCNVDYSSVAPDKLKWIPNKPAGTGAVDGATRKPPEVWFAWGAARDDPNGLLGEKCSSPNGRPQPYVYIARIDDQTLNQVGEYDIWNASYAFAYPALGTSSDGREIGVALGWGGPNHYASSAAGYLGDFVVYYNELSDATLERFGDYFTVRSAGPNTGSLRSRFSSQGYAIRLADPTIPNGCNEGGCTLHPHYVEWGRPLIE